MNCYNLCAASEAIENAFRYKWMGRVESRMALSGKDVAIAMLSQVTNDYTTFCNTNKYSIQCFPS